MSARTLVTLPRCAAALAAVAVAISVPLASAAGRTAAAPRAAAASGPVQVAVVESASGGHLEVRHANGSTSALVAGGTIGYQETVLAGPGAAATITVTVPSGHSEDEQLLFFRSTGGAHHKVTLRGAGRTTEVTVG